MIEAAAFLVLARAALSTLPFGTAQRLVARAAPYPPGPPRGDAACAGRAVASVARRLPAMTCLVQAVAAQAMLRRRGFESTVRYGVRSGGNGRALDSHAWLVCGGRVVVGEAEMSNYATLEGASSR